MTKRIVARILLLLLMPCSIPALAADREASMPAKHAAVFKQYCLDCHDAQTQEGSIDLENIPFEVSKDISTAERWQKILNAINAGEMPRNDAEPLSNADKTAFVEDLSEQMVVARRVLSDSGGVITMRRLNRREYANTIESLLVWHCPDRLPPIVGRLSLSEKNAENTQPRVQPGKSTRFAQTVLFALFPHDAKF